MDGCQDTARVAVKLVFSLGIAYLLDGIAGNGLQVYIYITAHLAHEHYLSGCHKRLTSHAGTFVVSQELVEDGITYLVGHLVGMAFRY